MMHDAPAWLIILGGVALILSGARSLRKGLDRLFGPRLYVWMQRVTDAPFRAFFTGLGVSILTLSSTTVSLLAVQTMQAGKLSVRAMLAVMLGANIGLTAMVLLISVRVDAYWPVLIVPGVVLFQFTQRSYWRGTGQTMLGLGLIFLGILAIRQTAMHSAGDAADLTQLLEIAGRHSLLLLLIAAILGLLLQSATAAIGLAIGLAGAGIMPLNMAIPVVAGVNIGIALTTLLFGWSQLDSRRLAVGNLLIKLVLALAILPFRDTLAEIFTHAPGTSSNQIAYFNTAFNIVLAIVVLPLLDPLSRFLAQLMPESPAEAQRRFGPRYINAPVDNITMALGQSLREIVRMAEIARGMLTDLWQALRQGDEALAMNVAVRDDEIDLLDREIKRYMSRLSRFEGDPPDAHEQMRQLGYLNELETIGDIIDKNLSELVLKKIRTGITFSREGWRELEDYYEKVANHMLIAENAFATRDRTLAQQLLNIKDEMGRLERELRDRHFARLNAGLQITHESSAVHLDLLIYLKRINSSVCHVAYSIMQNDDQ